jgi:hypothetical protein
MSILRNGGGAGFGLGCVIAVALSWRESFDYLGNH